MQTKSQHGVAYMEGAHFERDGWSCLLVEIVIKRFDHCPCWDDGIEGSKKNSQQQEH